MSLFNAFFRLADRLLAPRVAHAHCDIPCGIYDPHLAQVAALTTIRMNQLINELPKPGPSTTPAEMTTMGAKLTRYVAAKEHHAELCKQELRIIWGDYFKPEHVQKYPDLHTHFWNALKLASKVRQENDLASAQQLLESVNKIAEIFWVTKGADSHRQPSLQTAGGEFVLPSAKK